MAKLGPYNYPDIRFGDAVEIAGRILTKFKGTVSVKGLAWELGMAEGSGTLFAKVAALRDFGLIEGRGELRISQLAQRVLHPASTEEGHEARAEAFQRVELLRQLYARFEGEIPDDMSLLVGLEEISKASRDEIVRRAPLIQKHLTDAIRVLGRPIRVERIPEYSGIRQGSTETRPDPESIGPDPVDQDELGLQVVAAGRRLAVPLTPRYIDVAITLLQTLRSEMAQEPRATSEVDAEMETESDEVSGEDSKGASDLDLGATDQLGI